MCSHAELTVVRLGDRQHDELLLGGRERRCGERLIESGPDAQRGWRPAAYSEQIGNETETTLDPFEQRTALCGRGFGGMNSELGHGKSPRLMRDEPCPPRGRGVHCSAMAGR